MKPEDIDKVRYAVIACAGAVVLVLAAGALAKPYLYEENRDKGSLLYFAGGG